MKVRWRSWFLSPEPSCNFVRFLATCPSKMHFSAGICLFFCRKKQKAHKQKQVVPVIARWGGFSRPGGQGSIVYVLCAEPKEHKYFSPAPGRHDRWPGWPRNCSCAQCECAFSGLRNGISLQQSVLSVGQRILLQEDHFLQVARGG